MNATFAISASLLLLATAASQADSPATQRVSCTPQVLASDGSCREGTIVNGHLEGQGKSKDGNWRLQEGTFHDGVFVYGKGRILEGQDVGEGEFIRSQLDGKGTYTWSDGRRYEGTFFEGRSAGYGRYTDRDGTVWEGEFTPDAKLNGFGKRINKDGTRLIGEFRDTMPFGPMLLVKPDGTQEIQRYGVRGQIAQNGSAPAKRDPGTGPQDSKPSDADSAAKKAAESAKKAVDTLKGLLRH